MPLRHSRVPSSLAQSLLLVLIALLAPSSLWAAAPGPQAQAIGPRQEPYEGQTVLSIEVEGARRYSEERLRAALGQRVGEPCSGETIEKGIENLWMLFQTRSEVEYLDEEGGGVHLRLMVVELPADLEPRFVGYDEVKLEKLLEWAQLENQRELFLHQVPRVKARILEGYRREGHYHVQVNPVIREPQAGDDPDEPGDVIFEIIEGPEVNVKDVVVHGNQNLPKTGWWFWEDGLEHLASTELEGPSFFDWNGKELVEETLRADLVAMRNVYRDRGFLNAVVDLDHFEFNDDKSRVTVHVIVDEGQPFIVSEVRIEAFSLEPHDEPEKFRPLETPTDLLIGEDRLRRELELKPGARYERVLVAADHYALRDLYGKDGYIEHQSLGDKYSWKWLDPELIYDLEKAEVEVVYRISQGQPVRIREVQIDGITHTLDRVVRRELSVEPGALANMEQIVSSVRRLTRLNFFSDDRNPLEHRDPYFRFVPVADEPGLVDIVFTVEEGRVVDFVLSGGVDSNDGLFGIISLTMRNFDLFDMPSSFWGSFGEIYRKEAFHGAGQTLNVEFSPGAQRNQSRLRFVEPDIFGLHKDRWSFTGEFSIYDRIYEHNDEKRTTRSVSFGRQLGYDGNVSIGFTSRDIAVGDLSDEALNDPEMGALQGQVGEMSLNGLTLGASYFSTDATYNPKDGRILSWKNEVNPHQLGSDLEIFSSSISWDEYFKLGRGIDSVAPGLRLSTGYAIAVPYGRGDVIPYSERYFLGGFNTLRGFRYRGVGPNSADGLPLGGESMARFSLEYRHPLITNTRPGTYQEIEMFRFHVFLDGGLLAPDHNTMAIEDSRVSAGFGFALIYPIPLAFNFGWPLRDGHGDRKQVFSFNLAIR